MFSIVVSVFRTIISVFDVVFNRRANRLNAINIFATHHGKYSDLLSATQQSTEEAKKELCDIAYKTLNEIIKLLDCYDKVSNTYPTLSEMYYSVTDMIHSSFQPQLSWQTSVNIYERLNQFRFVNAEKKSLNFRSLKRKVNKETVDFKKEYSRNPDQRLEQIVLNSSKFRLYFHEMMKRFDYSKQKVFFDKLFKILAPYCYAINKYRALLANASKTLEAGLAQNKNEGIPLRNSQNLYDRYISEKCRLELLQQFNFSEVKYLNKYDTREPIQNLIYIGTVLKMISSSWSW